MEKWVRLTAEQRENLVAYLDGELEDHLTQQIDQVLVQSEVARHEVEALARTWEMLDLLPRPNAPQDFTERTLHTLQVSEMRTRLVDQPWFGYVRKGAIAVLWAVGLAACAAVGFAITTRGIPHEHADLLTNLPVVKNVDVYLEVRDLDFALELQRAGVFSVTEADDGPSTPRRLQISKPASSNYTVLEQRSAEIAKMTASERRRIQYNWTTFQALSPTEQQEIRTLHAQLEEQPDSLHALLDTYAMWLQTLTPGQRDDLRRATSSADRLRLVREFKDKQDANRETQLFDLNLDLQRMKPRFPPPPYLREDQLTSVMDILQQPLVPPLPKNMPTTERYFRILGSYGWGSQRQLSDDQVRQIIELLDENDREQQLMKHLLVSRSSADQQRRDVMFLIAKSLTAHAVATLEPYYPTKDQLQEFFTTLDGERRHKLMQMRSDDLTRELLKAYFEQMESQKPELKTPREWVLRLREFRPPDGSRGLFRGFPGPPPGDGRGSRGDGPRAESSRGDGPSAERPFRNGPPLPPPNPSYKPEL